MDEGGAWMLARAVEKIYQSETDTGVNSNATKALINSLIFAESKSVRTSTIILAAFNVCAALTTAFSILYDCYWASKRLSPNNRAEKFCVSKIHPAETFPLVLSLGIAIQGCLFAGAQSVGLKGIYVNGCDTVGQLVFPAIFLVPYIQLVFGLECAFRSFRTLPFQARGKYDVSICLFVIMLMTIGTWIPTHIYPENEYCFASLLWFVTRYGVEGLIMLSIIAGISIINAIIIFRRCTTGSLIDQHQRIAASRMVYYLVLAVVPLAFILPWFVTLTMEMPTLTTSMMATVVLNLSGLMNGALHIFLRSNTAITSFGPKDLSGWGKRKHEIRIWGPNELGFDGHLLQPVSGPRSESRNSLIHAEKVLSMESMRSPQYQYIKSPGFGQPQKSPDATSPRNVPTQSEPSKPTAVALSPSRRHQRKQSYSLFPAEPTVTSPPGTQLPATTFSPTSKTAATPTPNIVIPTSIFATQADNGLQGDGLESIYISADLGPPPKIHVPGGTNRHFRNSSMASSATVQIGLRLSHAIPDESTYKFHSPSNSSSTIDNNTLRPSSPFLKIQTQNLAPPQPQSRNPLKPSPLNPTLPTPSASDTNNTTNKPTNESGLLRSGSIDKAERDKRMKTLPPVPRMQSAISRLSERSGEEVQIQLSPTVYSPSSTSTNKKPETELNSTSVARTGSGAKKIGLPSRPGPSSPRDAMISSPVKPLNLTRLQPLTAQNDVRGSKADWI